MYIKMKKQFSQAWKSSKKPGKQRKYLVKSPLNTKTRLMRVNLSKELRKKYGKRNIGIRKGDVIKVMRGKFKKKTGKITSVNRKRMYVEIEGMQIKKQDGSKANVKFSPSILQITEMHAEDKKRTKRLKLGKTEKNSENKPGENKNVS